jgi:hypothetical protein
MASCPEPGETIFKIKTDGTGLKMLFDEDVTVSVVKESSRTVATEQ